MRPRAAIFDEGTHWAPFPGSSCLSVADALVADLGRVIRRYGIDAERLASFAERNAAALDKVAA